MNKLTYLILLIILVCYSCNKKTKKNKLQKTIDSLKIYTKPSKKINKYLNFNSPNAINTIAKIENEYFNDYNYSTSRYYGTQWYNSTGQSIPLYDSISVFQRYALEKENIKLDSMHCNIYAVKALEAGFGEEFQKIKKYHIDIWSNREYAGWSLGYILTKYYNWEAYLFISKNSNEYNQCKINYKKDKKYHVWKQPNIPIQQMLDIDDDKAKINQLLNSNEFGWGFSYQGWHTWFTRFDNLKECNWLGAPGKRYDTEYNAPLFKTTKFLKFYDYNSHIIIFPPQK